MQGNTDEWSHIVTFLDPISKNTVRACCTSMRELLLIEWGRKELLTTAVAREGYLNLLKYCRRCNYEWNLGTSKESVNKSNSIEVFKYLAKHNCDYHSSELIGRAITSSRTDFLEFFNDKFGPCTQRDFSDAIYGGNLISIQWLHDNNIEYPPIGPNFLITHHTIILANKIRAIRGQEQLEVTALDRVRMGDLIALKRVYREKKAISYEKCSTIAATFGYLDILQWLNKKGLMSKNIFLISVIKDRQYEVFKYLSSVYSLVTAPVNKDVCFELAMRGQWDTLLWAINQGYCFHTVGCALASSNQMELLKIIISKGYIVTEFLLSSAAASGQVEMVKYVYNLLGRWDPSVYTGAISSGNLRLVKYLRKQGCPLFGEQRDRYSILKKSRATLGAVTHNYLGILKYLRKHSFPWGAKVLIRAISNGSLSIVKWIYSNNGKEMFKDREVEEAVFHCDSECIKEWIKSSAA